MKTNTTEYLTIDTRTGNIVTDGTTSPHYVRYRASDLNRYRITDGNGENAKTVYAVTEAEAIERYAPSKRAYGIETVHEYKSENGETVLEASSIGDAMRKRNEMELDCKLSIRLDNPESIMQASVEIARACVSTAMRYATGNLVVECGELYNALRASEITNPKAKDLADCAVLPILETLASGGTEAEAMNRGFTECHKWLRSEGYEDTSSAHFEAIHLDGLAENVDVALVASGLARIVRDCDPLERDYLEDTKAELRDYVIAGLLPLLTASELETVALLECGQSEREIAKALGVSCVAIHKRKTRIRSKCEQFMDDNGISYADILTARHDRTERKQTEHTELMTAFRNEL